MLTAMSRHPNKVIDDPDHRVYANVAAAFPEIHAVEMEGIGAGVSAKLAQSERAVGFLMIRGISDEPGSGAGKEQRSQWKDYAVAVAAAFTRGLIEQLPARKIRADDNLPNYQGDKIPLQLGELRWISKRTPFLGLLGARVGPIVIAAIAVGLFFGGIIASPKLSAWISPDKGGQAIISTLLLFILLCFAAFWMRKVDQRVKAVSGFCPTGNLSGFRKEGDGSISEVKLGGPGIVCPHEMCDGHLRFRAVESTTFLECQRNSDHCFRFDHTRIPG